MKTTKKQFDYFKKRVKYWQKEFSLLNFDIFCFHSEGEDYLASCKVDQANRQAVVNLSKTWDTDLPLNNNELDKCAFHEVMELMLDSIRLEGRAMGLSDVFMVQHGHDIIIRWQNYIFND